MVRKSQIEPVEKVEEVELISDEEVEEVEPVIKVKKPMSEAKKGALDKARDASKKNTEVRRALNKMKIEEAKRELEEKMIEQAIKLKKKQIKAVRVLEDIAKDLPVKSKYIFM